MTELTAHRPLRFAIVGCGRVFERHVQSIEALNDAEISAVCDIDSDALNRATERTDAAGYRSLSALLKEFDGDVVALATPSGLHPTQAIDVAEHGFHVLTEKPMATRWSDGLRMVEACRRADVELFVVKQQRFSPTVRLLRRVFDEERFGRLYSVNINVFWTRPQEYYDLADWRGTWELDGGALMNQAIHYVDLLQWLAGPVESVHATTATLARRIEVEDTAAVTLRWRSGAVGSLNVSMLTYPSNLEASITILGERGTVRVGGVACNEIEHWEFEDDHPMDDEVEAATHETASVYGCGHPALYREVLSALRGDDSDVVRGNQGLKALEIVIAAYRSARRGERVFLPLDD